MPQVSRSFALKLRLRLTKVNYLTAPRRQQQNEVTPGDFSPENESLANYDRAATLIYKFFLIDREHRDTKAYRVPSGYKKSAKYFGLPHFCVTVFFIKLNRFKM